MIRRLRSRIWTKAVAPAAAEAFPAAGVEPVSSSSDFLVAPELYLCFCWDKFSDTY